MPTTKNLQISCLKCGGTQNLEATQPDPNDPEQVYFCSECRRKADEWWSTVDCPEPRIAGLNIRTEE
jgi:hypothetical protein